MLIKGEIDAVISSILEADYEQKKYYYTEPESIDALNIQVAADFLTRNGCKTSTDSEDSFHPYPCGKEYGTGEIVVDGNGNHTIDGKSAKSANGSYSYSDGGEDGDDESGESDSSGAEGGE